MPTSPPWPTIELDQGLEHGRELAGLAEQLGFPLYLGVGRLYRGFAWVESGEGEAGIAEMQQAMDELAGIEMRLDELGG